MSLVVLAVCLSRLAWIMLDSWELSLLELAISNCRSGGGAPPARARAQFGRVRFATISWGTAKAWWWSFRLCPLLLYRCGGAESRWFAAVSTGVACREP